MSKDGDLSGQYEVAAESIESIALGRCGRLQEWADVVTCLASPRAGYTTGSIIRIDRGLIANI